MISVLSLIGLGPTPQGCYATDASSDNSALESDEARVAAWELQGKSADADEASLKRWKDCPFPEDLDDIAKKLKDIDRADPSMNWSLPRLHRQYLGALRAGSFFYRRGA